MNDKKRFDIFSTSFLSLLAIIILLPILLVFASSLTDEKSLIADGYTILPQKLSWASYYYMIQKDYDSPALRFIVIWNAINNILILQNMRAFIRTRLIPDIILY